MEEYLVGLLIVAAGVSGGFFVASCHYLIDSVGQILAVLKELRNSPPSGENK